LELVFVPQGYPLDQLLLLLYVVGVEILQHTCLYMWELKSSLWDLSTQS
jgi:hypothetical protein